MIPLLVIVDYKLILAAHTLVLENSAKYKVSLNQITITIDEQVLPQIWKILFILRLLENIKVIMDISLLLLCWLVTSVLA